MKQRLLCFGDSNTWGYMPLSTDRYDEETRWPMRLQKLLGEDWMVIEEGFNGRTIVHDDPVEGGYKSALNYLPPCLMSHNPLDAILIMLGTNDTKQRFGMSAETIGRSMDTLLRAAKAYAVNPVGGTPRIILVSPPLMADNLSETRFGPQFGSRASEIIRQLAPVYRSVAEGQQVECFDAAPYAEVSPLDAIHMTAGGHQHLAEALADVVRNGGSR